MVKKINGKKLSEKVFLRLKKEISELDVKPGLAAVLIGDNAESELYVRLKEKQCDELGIYFEKHLFEKNVDEKTVIDLIEKLNADKKIHAILVQLPLPKNFDTQKIIGTVDSKKDVDGFHPKNIENFMAGEGSYIRPVLIKAVMGLIDATGESLREKRVVILGKSDVFMRPLGSALLRRHAQVLWQTIDGEDWERRCESADVLITALGKPHFIKKIKPGAILIDVGITKDVERVRGDIALSAVEMAGWATPVPGGVGPMTIAMLMENVVEMAKAQSGLS